MIPFRCRQQRDTAWMLRGVRMTLSPRHLDFDAVTREVFEADQRGGRYLTLVRLAEIESFVETHRT